MPETSINTQTKGENEQRKTSVLSRVKYVLCSVHVEPLVFLFIFSRMVMLLATQNLYIQKACKVNLHIDGDNCTALENLKNYQNDTIIKVVNIDTQAMVTKMNIWLPILQFGVPCLFAIYMGSWSDRNRKRVPFILLPMFGDLFHIVGLLVCVFYFNETTMEVTGLTEIFTSLSGSRLVLFNAVFSYVGDVTKEESKTLRIGIINLISTIAMAIGTAISGISSRNLGFLGVFYIALILVIIGLICGVVLINEVPSNKSSEVISQEKEKNVFQGFFHVKHIKEAFKTTFKEGPNKQKLKVIMVLSIIILVMGPLQGEMNFNYLNTNLRFNWNEVDFSIYGTYYRMTNIAGTTLSIGLFSRLLKIDDGLIGVMACLGKIIAGFFYTFATAEWVYYLGPLADIMGSTVFITTRSILTKIVKPAELGQVMAIYGILESLVPILFGSLYGVIYNHTKTTLPGAYNLVGMVLAVPAVLINLWLYKENKIQNKNHLEETEIEDKKLEK